MKRLNLLETEKSVRKFNWKNLADITVFKMNRNGFRDMSRLFHMKGRGKNKMFVH